ncbi:MAG TPA: DUF2723 domain-containing protein [Verrucomicrobiae bacterium]|nr:DUF2723 domain-containing protein [Verrucomicrobiae bacterium]
MDGGGPAVTVLAPGAARSRAAVTAALLFAGFFALYASMTARAAMFGDAFDLIPAAVRYGVAHPPGFPVWVVLAHLASLVPLGPVAYRVNLTAAFYHAIAVALVYCSGYVLVRKHAPALFAAFALGIGSPLFVAWSLQAESFSLNDAFAAAIVLLCLAWLAEPARWRLMLPLALLFGFGMANHQTLVELAPLPLWAAWCGRKAIAREPRAWRTAALCALLLVASFCLPYVQTLLASDALTHWRFGAARSLPELLDLIDRRTFGTFNLVAGRAEQGGTLFERLWLCVATGGWTYLAIGLGLVGLALRRRYAELAFAGWIVAVALIAFCGVANVNVETEIARGIFARFGLLPLVALAPFCACGVYAAQSLVRDARARTIATTVLAVAALAGAALRLPSLSLAGVQDTRTVARDVLAALPPRAILLCASAAIEVVVEYYQQSDGLRPDVTAIDYGYLMNGDYRRDLDDRGVLVPDAVALPMSPNEQRDVMVRANPGRPFFVVGDRPIHAPGPISQPLVLGLVSQMIPLRARIDVAAHYRREVALESAPGYGDVSAGFWRSNGFSDEIRGFYAGGFFVAGSDAKYLGDRDAARYWYERAAAYSDDPLIERELESL